ncbi:phosphoglycolate phosphatase [Halopseudomonas xinjiangensis]|uniref:Phosphoglycolate phosphatase n=1 Tax=Halopseudomonas xinjiangensis TaxID=487184 RepID=A0A1H1RKI0_9GAMM|nr:HAD-IA family hydrolase [Halopseudomonas xinjiangensis]SDS36287.1 phosphoglycolate phosphatase [Halopseudomonas xinjiangensis]
MADLRALIFDWDGTLADSVLRIVRAMQAAADLTELPRCSDRAVKDIIGLGLPEAISTLYPTIDADQAEVLRSAYSGCYLQLEQTPSPLFPGVLDALDAFRRQGVKLAVATGKSRRGLQRVMAAHDLEGFFDSTRCADETASKPDPLMLRLILAELDVQPAQAMMLGDSEFDLRMASAAGVRPVAVSYGAQPREHLLRFAPERCIDDFNEFHGWVMPQLSGRPVTEV